jgi:hypothetical protein
MLLPARFIRDLLPPLLSKDDWLVLTAASTRRRPVSEHSRHQRILPAFIALFGGFFLNFGLKLCTGVAETVNSLLQLQFLQLCRKQTITCVLE